MKFPHERHLTQENANKIGVFKGSNVELIKVDK